MSKNDEVYMPWLGKKGSWKDQVHNEIHLLVARVQSERDLEAQIEHGNDFVSRFTELIEAVIVSVKQDIGMGALNEAHKRQARLIEETVEKQVSNRLLFKVLQLIEQHQTKFQIKDKRTGNIEYFGGEVCRNCGKSRDCIDIPEFREKLKTFQIKRA